MILQKYLNHSLLLVPPQKCVFTHMHALRNSSSRDGSLLKDTVLKTKQPRRRVIPLLPALLAGMQIAQINDLEFLEFPSRTLHGSWVTGCGLSYLLHFFLTKGDILTFLISQKICRQRGWENCYTRCNPALWV